MVDFFILKHDAERAARKSVAYTDRLIDVAAACGEYYAELSEVATNLSLDPRQRK